MDWHNITEDYEESPAYQDAEYKTAEAGNSESYSPVEYVVPKTVAHAGNSIDDDLRAFFNKMENPQQSIEAKQITQPTIVEFNFVPRIDHSQETRNRLYLGTLSTKTQSHRLWGFDTWQEFSDHLHPEDHKLAREFHEEIMTELTLMTTNIGAFRRRLWCIHEDRPTAGYWAMTIDLLDTDERLVFSFYKNKKYINQASILKRNELYYNPKNWQEI